LSKYKIAETETFDKKIKTTKYKDLYKKISEYVYPILRENPYFGTNIKKLKGSFKDIYRYRIGDYRLFYKISEETVIIFIINIEARKDAYKWNENLPNNRFNLSQRFVTAFACRFARQKLRQFRFAG